MGRGVLAIFIVYCMCSMNGMEQTALNSELPCAVFITVYAVNTSTYLAVSALFPCLNLTERAVRKTDLS